MVMSAEGMRLVWPAREYLSSYVDALERGWSPDNLRGETAAREELSRIAADPDGFVASLVDLDATGDPIVLPDGTSVKRLPGYRRWMWDGEFCGSIGFRWLQAPSREGRKVMDQIGRASCRERVLDHV